MLSDSLLENVCLCVCVYTYVCIYMYVSIYMCVCIYFIGNYFSEYQPTSSWCVEISNNFLVRKDAENEDKFGVEITIYQII